jgi:ubiquinone biosynthesis protein
MAFTSLVKKVQNAVRFTEVVHILARHGFADLLTRMDLIEGAPAKIMQTLRLIDKNDEKRLTQAERLRLALTELGPTFVKLGQILSSRPDLVGVQLSNELQDLQDNVAPMDFEEMRAVFEENLGQPVDALFSEFVETPIATASLSQVYKAKLKTGETVAVKIQKPGIEQIIHSDMQLLRSIAEWVSENAREFAWMDPVGLMDEITRSVNRELDFQIERQIMEEFRKNFERLGDVFIPNSYPSACGDKVLTMDFVDGVRIDAVDHYAERNSDPVVVARTGCHAVCMQITEDRLFHADPHPGNIMLTRNNQIAFLDFGMVDHLEFSDIESLAEVLMAVFDRDPDRCIETLLMFTVSREVANEEAFRRDVSDYISFEAEAVVSGGLIGKALERIVQILHRHQLRLAPRFSLLLKALMTIESTGKALDPQLDMIPILRPYIKRVIAKRMSPLRMVRDVRHDIVNAITLGRELPDDIRLILKQLKKGRLKLQVSHEDLEHAAGHVDRASNRLTFGIITSSLIIGSSLLVRAGSPTNWLGIIGYCIAGVLGLGLIVVILRSRKY